MTSILVNILVNWKTSLGGIGLIALGVADAFNKGPNGPGAAWAEIVAGFTALMAKDGNVTGVA